MNSTVITPEEIEQIPAEEQPLAAAVSLLQAGQQFYNEGADEGELDLVNHVRQRLFDNGISNEELTTCFDQSCFIQEANGRHTHAQQWNITRWVDYQLTLVQAQDNVDTRLLRYQAVYELKTDDWLKVFDTGLLPNLLEHGLRTAK